MDRVTRKPLLRARGVGITHDGAEVATPADVSFEVRPGEVVLVLGPSGSGKSTLALALNGLVPHDVPAEVRGTIEVAGSDAAKMPVSELSRTVGMVFQDPDAQLVTGTVLDEVAFGPENLLVPVDEVLERAEAALRRVGLWERRGENPDRLSGGGRQRLAIAAALAMGSPVLVLDEPTANLDPRGIDDVYAALAEVVGDGGRSIVLIEHNLDAAVDLVDRVLVIDAEGRSFADGTVDEVLRAGAEELHGLGVWLPTSTLAALTLRRAGYVLDPLPLTPAELHAALEASPPPPPIPSRYAGIDGDRKDAAENAPQPESSPTSPKPHTTPAIRVRGLSLSRGGTEVLHGVDLDVGAGGFLAVVGANGAGKTSLVQAIAGVVRPPRGTVFVDGVDVHRIPPKDLPRRIGFVFQNPEHQFIAHTAFDELAHGLRMQRLPEEQVRARAEEVLERFGLTRLASTHPFLLSGGQKRRLSVGTALVAGAKVLALDEPTFGQDRARADELLELLSGLQREGTTVVVVTHDMQLVAEHADHTVVLSEGRVAAAGPTSEIFADDALLERTDLRPPPLRRALAGVTRHPELARVSGIRNLPGPSR